LKHKVIVERNTLRFSAGHFATYDGDCEPLHGHNYGVIVELEGDLTEDSWVFDFVRLKEIVWGLCKPLDHRFILQRNSAVLSINEDDDYWHISFGDRRYVMPKRDVCALPIDNSTAERLAEWLCLRLKESLAEAGANNVMSITVGIEEAPGQAGWCSLTTER
jgi:6-pyruvoyltetrahydropterin/6-carboxytetrahydropterin synthase